jgi:hypothetical protein
MKKEIYSFRLSVLLLGIVMFIECRKSAPPFSEASLQSQTQGSAHVSTQTDSVPIPYPQTPLTGCYYAPNYGDSIVFPQPTSGGSDYIVSPINNPGTGTYISWPQGLVINSTTGAIDVTKSQTGERFDIGFVKKGTTDTCITSLILGGASYMDSTYILADGETKAFPYFNANPYLPSICSTPGSCAFDVNHSARNMKVAIDPNTGMIDLNKTLNGPGGPFSVGAFGVLPLNGQVVSPDIYYQLNDESNMALQNITVNLIYYEYKSQIPSTTLNKIGTILNNILLNVLILNQGNPRPPMIIITRFN